MKKLQGKKIFKEITLPFDFSKIFYIRHLFDFSFRVAGEYATILMTGLPVRQSFIPIIDLFN